MDMKKADEGDENGVLGKICNLSPTTASILLLTTFKRERERVCVCVCVFSEGR